MARMAEWKVARDLVTKCDDRTMALRKTGFGFITALITAESILATGAAGKELSHSGKYAVVLVTLLLLVLLRLVERQGQLVQEAAALRANILERALNLGLTEVISDKYHS